MAKPNRHLSASQKAFLASLDKPRKELLRPSNRFGSGLDTLVQAACEMAANRILGRAKFFPKREKRSEAVAEAEGCGTHGLRPTWHGRP